MLACQREREDAPQLSLCLLQEGLKLSTIEMFSLQQRRSQPMQLITMRAQDRASQLAALAQNPLHLGIDESRQRGADRTEAATQASR